MTLGTYYLAGPGETYLVVSGLMFMGAGAILVGLFQMLISAGNIAQALRWLGVSIPITQSTPKTAVLVGRRPGGSERRRSHPLIGAAHQTTELAQDGLLSWFESRQVGLFSR